MGKLTLLTLGWGGEQIVAVLESYSPIQRLHCGPDRIRIRV